MLKLSFSDTPFEAGLDEVGRGCLAGPVVATAVILPKNFHHKELNDSKKLNPNKRKQFSEIIKQNALAFSIEEISERTIEKINILQSTFLAMHHAIEKLSIKPSFLLVDGNRFKPFPDIPSKCIVKGDSTYLNIAAASILAKVYRDDLMEKLHEEFPVYDWINNKGYPTKKHREAIQKYGICPHHRTTFQLLSKPLSIDL